MPRKVTQEEVNMVDKQTVDTKEEVKQEVTVEGEKIPDSKALVFGRLDEQFHLPWKDQANLIRSMEPLTESGVRIAVRTCRELGLPLQGINLIPTKNGVQAYVNSDGLRWRLHNDVRGLKESTAEITHRPTREEPWIECMGRVVMGDGSLFTNIGVVPCAPGSNDIGNSIMRAMTKCKRRAAIDSVGIIIPLYEEYVEWLDEQKSSGKFVDGEFKEVSTPRVVSDPTTVAQLTQWISSIGHTTDEATMVLGITMGAMMADIPGAVKTLKEKWGIK